MSGIPDTMTRIFFLLLKVLPSSLCFNLDTEQPTIFPMDKAGFGYSVVQYIDSRHPYLVVGAPQEITSTNHTGGLYMCDYHKVSCVPIPLQAPQEAVNMSLGLSLAAHSSQLLACGPTVHQACRKNLHLTGFCFLLENKFSRVKMLPSALQECPKQEQDIVFLIDGSGSINPQNFAKMLTFVKSVMVQFPRPSSQFSLMQFSSIFQVHFTFKEFTQFSDPLRLLDQVKQLTGATFTASAIQRVTKDLFTASYGSREGASKTLIVITDGEKVNDPLNYEDVIPQAEAKGIVRYAVGVGSAFRTARSYQELKAIASEPSDRHIFQVENFDGLKDIRHQLKEKIFAIEGTQAASSSSFEFEMSQEGFSAVLTPEGPVLGAVGSFGWSGGAFLYPSNMRPTFINMSQENMDMRDSYLGYSTELVLWKGVQSLVLGAPRHRHTGKVVIFTKRRGEWTLHKEVTGTQMGSYFGASLCSVDVNRDGSTDLVLIGAPHYYEQTRGGQVSVCPLPRGMAPWHCEEVLRGTQGHPWSRFGAALTVLGDVNRDNLMDVVIGAPGEQENQGAVYLFHGTPDLGISPSHSQRIVSSQLSPRLWYFGQSLSGGQDLSLDGLEDLAVGASGHAVLLRTRPVLRVLPKISITPPEIPRSVFECQEHAAPVKELGEAQVCLHIYESPRSKLGSLQSSVTFDLTLDPGRLNPRALFQETMAWNLTRVQVRELGNHCEVQKLLLLACVEDSVTPIILRLNFSLEGNPIASHRNLRPILAMDEPRYFMASLPFEKNCGADHVCQDDLGISFDFAGLKILLVGSNLQLNINVTVWNSGEDSYGTTITFFYPADLSYRRWAGTQNHLQKRSLRLTCESSPTGSQGMWSTRCTMNHLIFHENTQLSFMATFDVSPKAKLGDKLLLRTNVNSENNTPRTNKTTFQLGLPVKYAVYTVINSHEQSTKYLNFSASEEEKSIFVQHRFQVNNLGHRDLPVSINLWVPVELNRVAVWTMTEVFQLQNPSLQCFSERTAPTETNFRTQIQKTRVLDCSIASCLRFRCDISSFGVQEKLDFILKGNLSLGWFSQMAQKKVLVVSVAEIMFDKSTYSQFPGQEAFLRSQMEMALEKYEVYNPIPLIVGSSVGGLLLLALITATLYKLGFFKRHYKEMMAEENAHTAPENATSDPQVSQ